MSRTRGSIVAGAAHHDERGVDQPADLGGVGVAPLGQRPVGDARATDRRGNNVLHTRNTIPDPAPVDPSGLTCVARPQIVGLERRMWAAGQRREVTVSMTCSMSRMWCWPSCTVWRRIQLIVRGTGSG